MSSKTKRRFAKGIDAIGILLVVVVIMMLVPLSLPRMFGFQLYEVASESMEPTYPVGGVIYVKECAFADLNIGDVVTYTLGTDTDYVLTHRIVDMDTQQRTLITKGDANSANDPEPVNENRIVGKVVGYLPWISNVAAALQGTEGIALLIILFVAAVVCWLGADILKKSAGLQEKEAGQKSAATRKTAASQETAVYEEPSKAEKKMDVSDRIRLIVRIVAILMIIGAAVYLFRVFAGYHAGETEYAALSQEIDIQIQAARETLISSEQESASDAHLSAAAQDEAIHNAVKNLQAQNEDTVGWISFENMEISYPVMQAEDNDFYLYRTFSKESNSMGSIFIDALNHDTLEDSHTIIYGHNMRNLSMFGRLRYYKEAEFYEGNEYFYLYTENTTYKYQIFSYYDVSEYSDIYTIWYTPDDNFASFLEQMKRRSYYDTGVEVGAEDKIVTLSTCSTEGNRFVIHAKRVE